MFFWDLFVGRPFAVFSIAICLATIYSCIVLKRETSIHTADRFLVGLVGLIAIYQGLRIVREVGLLPMPVNSRLSDGIDLIVTLIFFQAPVILRKSRDDRMITDQELRLARAAPPILSDLTKLRDEVFAQDIEIRDLAVALGTLSDAAFKLYAYHRLNPPALNPAVPINQADIERLRREAMTELCDYIRDLAPYAENGPVLENRGARDDAVEEPFQREQLWLKPMTVITTRSSAD